MPTFEDASVILRVLARSATGQEMSVYTTFSKGPRRAGDPDGPEEYHVVLLDNGRSNMVGSEFQDMLRCIRCGACMNHCPVYQAVGGHAYGWVYPGPMGAVLTPSLIGVEEGGQLPNASTFCGRCEAVCPVRIPLPMLMRHWREREFEKRLTPASVRTGLGVWAWFVARPRLYRLATRVGDGGAPGHGQGEGEAAIAAAGGRLDGPAGLSGAAGAHVHGPVEGARAMSARERILARVRGAVGGVTGRDSEVAERLAEHPAGPVPQQAKSHGPARLTQFMAKVEAAAATVSRVSAMDGAAAGAGARAQEPQPAFGGSLRGDPTFAGLDWGIIETSQGVGRIEEPATLSRGEFGLAETGTVVLASGPDNPVTLTFLGESHFVVLREADLCGGFEDFWAAWRERGLDPRTINMVTGPSRSADIGQVLQLGAHGPVALHVFVVGEG